jgi:hypothetical protein
MMRKCKFTFNLNFHMIYLMGITCITVKALNINKNEKDNEPLNVNMNMNMHTHYNVLYPNTTIFEHDYYEYAYGPCLNNLNCFLPYGICVNATTCMCMPDYAHIYIQGHQTELNCSYKKKKVLIAGLLELFLPLGLGHLYVGHYMLGSLKFFYNFIIYTFCCLLYCKGSNNEMLLNMMILCIVLTCAIPIWNIIDLFLFFSGAYTDGYGVPMN